MVKFAFTVLGQESQRHNFFENNLAVAKIFRAVAQERRGSPKLDLDMSVRDWAARKGFVSEDSLVELERAAGSRSYGMLLLLICRRHRKKEGIDPSGHTYQSIA